MSIKSLEQWYFETFGNDNICTSADNSNSMPSRSTSISKLPSYLEDYEISLKYPCVMFPVQDVCYLIDSLSIGVFV